MVFAENIKPAYSTLLKELENKMKNKFKIPDMKERLENCFSLPNEAHKKFMGENAAKRDCVDIFKKSLGLQYIYIEEMLRNIVDNPENAELRDRLREEINSYKTGVTCSAEIGKSYHNI